MEKLAPLLNVEVIPELGRKICEQLGYKFIGEIPDQEGFKVNVLNAQISAEKALGEKGFVADRSTVDCWVLWQRWNICKAMTYTTEEYYTKSLAQAAFYTHVVYVPPMFEPVEDGFRWADVDYQRQIDRLTRMTLYEWNLLDRTLFIKSLETESRVREVVNWLEERA